VPTMMRSKVLGSITGSVNSSAIKFGFRLLLTISAVCYHTR
jgi:hypothetical protein